MINSISIKYHNKTYPNQINSDIDEVAAHFDVRQITPNVKYSLHTEFS